MVWALLDKVDNMEEYMGNVSRELEILRKNQKQMLKIKNTAKEIRPSLRAYQQMDTDEERISELEDILIETWKTEKHGNKD